MYAKTILVIDGSSFIGSHFVEKLCFFSNYRIVVVDDNANDNLKKVRDQILVEKDLAKILNQYKFDAVFDFSNKELYDLISTHKALYIKFANENFKCDILIRCAISYGSRLDCDHKVSKWIVGALHQSFLYVNPENILNLVYIDDVCDAIIKIFHFGKRNQTYTITGQQQKEVDFVRLILRKLELPMTLIEYSHSSVDEKFEVCKNLFSLGWRPKVNIDVGLNLTIKWLKENQNAD